MYRVFGKTIGSVVVPVGLFGTALLLLFNLIALPKPVSGIVHGIPYLALIAAAGFGWWFNRSRIVFMSLVLLGVHWFLRTHYAAATPATDALGQIGYAALAVLVPLNAAAISWMEERGLFTEKGVSRLAVLALQAVVVAACVRTDVWLSADGGAWVAGLAGDILHFRLFPKGFDFWTFLPQPALVFFILALAPLGWAIYRNPRAAMEIGLLGATLAAMIALHLVGKGQGASVFLGVAGLSLVMAMAQDTYRMAFIDELTNLPSRRALDNALMKLGRRYTIAMLDVDHFKKFNDTHGHDVGDQVLRMVAARMERVGGGGRAFRYGGEEFTVLFSRKSAADALPALENLRKDIQKSSFTLRGKDRPKQKPDQSANAKDKLERVSVTISIGLAEPGDDAGQPDEVIKAADDALYRAKKGGRNKVSA